MDDLKAGLAKGGKQRGDIEFNMWLFVAPNDDRKQAIEDARATVAFYGGVEQYEPYFAAHGFRQEAQALQEGVKRGDYLSVKHLVTDEMAQTFVVCGTPDEVRKRVSADLGERGLGVPQPAVVRPRPGRDAAVRREDRGAVLSGSSQCTVFSSQFRAGHDLLRSHRLG